ncbi:MAG: hypothetical protein ACI9NQ_001093 [Paracoccaceae bacterium]|jgi:hypothetical protein
MGTHGLGVVSPLDAVGCHAQYRSEIALAHTKSCHLDNSSQAYFLHSAAKDFGKMMAEKSCPAAAKWLDSLPPSRAKNRAMIEVFYLWSD